MHLRDDNAVALADIANIDADKLQQDMLVSFYNRAPIYNFSRNREGQR